VARLRSGFDRGRRPRRMVQWTNGPGDETSRAFVATGLVILGLGIETGTQKFTITRIRGVLTFTLNTIAALANGFRFTYGIGIVSSDAFSVGVTAIPNPQDDMDWPWMYHGFTSMLSPTGTLSDIGSAAVVRIPVDVKAMRILNLNEVVFMAVDAAEVGSATASAQFDSRMLLKLF